MRTHIVDANGREKKVESLVLRYLVELDRGTSVLEELCHSHPRHAAELRKWDSFLRELNQLFALVRKARQEGQHGEQGQSG